MSDINVNTRSTAPVPAADAGPAALGQAGGATGASQAAAASAVQALEQIPALLESQATAGTAGANKYALSPNGPGLPPPSLPRLPATPATAAATQSFLAETQDHLRQAAALTGSNPANLAQLPLAPAGGRPQSVEQVAAWAQNQAKGAPELRKATISTLLLSRLTNDRLGAQSLEILGDAASASQNEAIRQQKSSADEAEKAAKKAAAKSKSLGIFAPIVTALTVIAAVALAVVTLGAASPASAAIITTVVALTTAALQIAKAAVQLKVSQHQADSKEALAQVGHFKSVVDQAETVYKSVQDTVQAIVASHDEAVRTVTQAIQQQGLLNNRIAQNV